MIGAMRHANETVQGPAGHRAVAALASLVVAYLIARLAIRLGVPETTAYAVCLVAGLVVAYRSWRVRVELQDERLRVHNTLASSTVPRADIRRVNERGAIEWHASTGRSTRAPVEALHRPTWSFGSGEATYLANRETVRTWLRAARRRAGEQESYTDVIPIVPLPDPHPQASADDWGTPPGSPLGERDDWNDPNASNDGHDRRQWGGWDDRPSGTDGGHPPDRPR